MKAPIDSQFLILVQDVPDVRISSVTLEDASTTQSGSRYLIEVSGNSSRITVDHAHFRGSVGSPWFGVGVESFPLKSTDEPFTVQRCTFSNLAGGVLISGSTNPPHKPDPVGRIIVRDNSLSECERAVILAGQLTDIHIVGNRMTNFVTAGIVVGEFAPLFEGSSGILIANNTIEMSRDALTIRGPINHGCGVQIRNNLLLAETGPDMAFSDDDSSVLEGWKISNNLRRVTQPTTADESKGWLLSPQDNDKFVTEVPLESSDASDQRDYLRPAADWLPATTQAAGLTEPSLPSYVGALPPIGVQPWDWSRTWLAPPGTSELLTVSQDPQDGGQHRTITDALKSAKPWATIRVLDDATYPERIVLDNPQRHHGLMIEAVQNATLLWQGPGLYAVGIIDVAHVRVRGLRLRENGAPGRSAFVYVTGSALGLIVDRLDIESSLSSVESAYTHTGVRLKEIRCGIEDPPVVVRDCRIQIDLDGFEANEAKNLLLYDNQIAYCLRGIILLSTVERTVITGNVVRGALQAGIQVQNPAASSAMLIANNTVFESNSLIRYWTDLGRPEWEAGRVVLANNLLFEFGGMGDLLAMQNSGDGTGRPSHELVNFVVRNWRFNHNFRETSGGATFGSFPLSRNDKQIAAPRLLSREPGPDYARLPLGSPLASGGAGGELPNYVGAVPPPDVEPWDWQVTWRSRVLRARYTQKTESTVKESQ